MPQHVVCFRNIWPIKFDGHGIDMQPESRLMGNSGKFWLLTNMDLFSELTSLKAKFINNILLILELSSIWKLLLQDY